MSARQRADIILFEQGLAPSREKARAMIMAGEVFANGQPVTKPGMRFDPETTRLDVKVKPRFVSRGGEKLVHALEVFDLDVTNTVCADVGASTGGFTDCLLQAGADKVYAIDVGYGQLDYRLRRDRRVVVLERTNARYLETLPQRVDLVVIDASFISLRLLLPVVKNWLQTQANVIPLIKPQFEAGREDVGKGGVVKDREVHRRVIEDILTFAQEIGYIPAGLTKSPLRGPAGNIEFLAWFQWGQPQETSRPVASLLRAIESDLA